MRLAGGKSTQWDHEEAEQRGTSPNGIQEWAGQSGAAPNRLPRKAEQ